MENEKPEFKYETLWKVIIRPPRDDYEEEFLGDSVFTFRKKTYIRKDYTLLSHQGYKLKCSFFEPEELCRPSPEMPVVIYLHGNSSSRLEGIRMINYLLKRNINLFVFDFAGCGKSEGEYVSLGYHEKKDLKVIVDFVEKLPGVGKIGLWGRSMGAATAMLYGCSDPRISEMCMDSPFADFYRLSKEQFHKQIKIPDFLISAAFSIIKGTVKKKNGLDISKLKPINCASNTTAPAFFIHALNDELIDINHTVELSMKYSGPNSVNSCKGGHNSNRPRSLIEKVGKFFSKYLLGIDENEILDKMLKDNYKPQLVRNISNENCDEDEEEEEEEEEEDER